MNNNPDNRQRKGSRIIDDRQKRQEKMRALIQAQESNRKFMITVIVSSIIVLGLIITLIVLAVNYKGCSDSVSNDTNINDNTDNHVSGGAMLKESGDMGQSYIDSIIFVGDSNTAHMRSFGVLSGGKNTNQVWVPESQTLMLDSEITGKKIVYPQTKEQITIAKAAEKSKPKYMVITLGTNGLGALDKDQFKYCYKKLIDAVKQASPSTKIMVQSIFPVTSSYDKISNSQIDRANSWLLELAGECNIKYLDTCSVLKNSSGALIEEYNSYHKDGYHVNKEAYEKILQYIRTHGCID